MDKIIIFYRGRDGSVTTVRTTFLTKRNINFVRHKDGRIRYLYNEALELLSKIEEEGQDNFYKTYYKKKRSGGFRRIDIPCEELKSFMREVNHFFTEELRFEFPEFVSAYVKKRSCKDAASKHTCAKDIIKLDIKDFFGSCTLEAIMESLNVIYPFCLINEEVLETIVKACMIEYDGKYRLAQGAPSSPLLSNLMMIPVDVTLNRIRDTNYTRYADDMVFSIFRYAYKLWKYKERKIDFIIQAATGLLKGKGLELNSSKTKVCDLKKGDAWILGMTVGSEVKIGNKKKQRIKAAIWNFMVDYKNGKIWPASDVRRLSGKVSYFKGVEPNFIEFVLAKYKEKLGLDYYELVKNILS